MTFVKNPSPCPIPRTNPERKPSDATDVQIKPVKNESPKWEPMRKFAPMAPKTESEANKKRDDLEPIAPSTKRSPDANEQSKRLTQRMRDLYDFKTENEWPKRATNRGNAWISKSSSEEERVPQVRRKSQELEFNNRVNVIKLKDTKVESDYQDSQPKKETDYNSEYEERLRMFNERLRFSEDLGSSKPKIKERRTYSDDYDEKTRRASTRSTRTQSSVRSGGSIRSTQSTRTESTLRGSIRSMQSTSTDSTIRKEGSIRSTHSARIESAIHKEGSVRSTHSARAESAIRKEGSFRSTQSARTESPIREEDSIRSTQSASTESPVRKEGSFRSTQSARTETPIRKEDSIRSTQSARMEGSIRKEDSVRSTQSASTVSPVRKEGSFRSTQSARTESPIRKEDSIRSTQSARMEGSIHKEDSVRSTQSASTESPIRKGSFRSVRPSGTESLQQKKRALDTSSKSKEETSVKKDSRSNGATLANISKRSSVDCKSTRQKVELPPRRAFSSEAEERPLSPIPPAEWNDDRYAAARLKQIAERQKRDSTRYKVYLT